MAKRGLFHGITTVDIQFLVEEYPPANTKSKADWNEVNTGGPATNAAITFSHLGGRGHLVSGIGNHHFTPLITDDLKHHMLEFTDLTPDYDHLPTFATIITSEKNGDRTVFSHHPKKVEIQKHVLDHLVMDSFDIVMLDGFFMDYGIELAKKANNQHISVVLDGGSWKPGMEKLLPYINIAICSNDFYPPGTQTEEEVFDYFSRYDNIRYVAITRGGSDILYCKNQESVRQINIEPVRAVDTLGAGDVFHGAFCYYFAINNDFGNSLRKASQVAGHSCKYFGTRSWMDHPF